MPKEIISSYGVPSEVKDAPVVNLLDTKSLEIMENVREKASQCKDTVLGAHNFSVSGQTGSLERAQTLFSETKPIPHTAYALGQLLTYLRIPRPYYKRCCPSLKAANFNYWMRQKGQKDFFVRTWNGIVRAFFTSRYSPEMDDVAVLPVVLEALEAEEKKNNPYILNFTKTAGVTTLVADFTNLRTRRVEGVDWVVSGGVTVVNSEIGLSSLRIQPVIIADRADNGARVILSDYSAPGARRFKHVGDTKIERVKEATQIALQLSGDAVAVALAALMTEVTNPEREVERLTNANPFITQGIVEGIAESLSQKDIVRKGDIVTSVIEACRASIPFQTRLHELIEVERSAAQYLGFFNGLSEKLSDILAQGTEEELPIVQQEEEATSIYIDDSSVEIYVDPS